MPNRIGLAGRKQGLWRETVKGGYLASEPRQRVALQMEVRSPGNVLMAAASCNKLCREGVAVKLIVADRCKCVPAWVHEF